MVKIWVDDIRPAPEGYVWCKSVNETITIIKMYSAFIDTISKYIEEPQTLPWIDEVNIDHDAGEYADCGGDYIKILDWMEKHHIKIPIHIHSQNPVGVENMRRIIERNGWTEVK